MVAERVGRFGGTVGGRTGTGGERADITVRLGGERGVDFGFGEGFKDLPLYLPIQSLGNPWDAMATPVAAPDGGQSQSNLTQSTLDFSRPTGMRPGPKPTGQP
jgi:hypothetical protein